MNEIDRILEANAQYAASFASGDVGAAPARNVAVVACMDARLDVYSALGLSVGDAHVMRNAGGVITDDMIRSLMISQRMLGTTQIVLVHHSECGLQRVNEDELRTELRAETGEEPSFSIEAFSNVDDSVRNSIDRIRRSPFIPHKNVRGFVYDVRTGALREVRPTEAR